MLDHNGTKPILKDGQHHLTVGYIHTDPESEEVGKTIHLLQSPIRCYLYYPQALIRYKDNI